MAPATLRARLRQSRYRRQPSCRCRDNPVAAWRDRRRGQLVARSDRAVERRTPARLHHTQSEPPYPTDRVCLTRSVRPESFKGRCLDRRLCWPWGRSQHPLPSANASHLPRPTFRQAWCRDTECPRLYDDPVVPSGCPVNRLARRRRFARPRRHVVFHHLVGLNGPVPGPRPRLDRCCAPAADRPLRRA
jgi:hypothetical protein